MYKNGNTPSIDRDHLSRNHRTTAREREGDREKTIKHVCGIYNILYIYHIASGANNYSTTRERHVALGAVNCSTHCKCVQLLYIYVLIYSKAASHVLTYISPDARGHVRAAITVPSDALLLSLSRLISYIYIGVRRVFIYILPRVMQKVCAGVCTSAVRVFCCDGIRNAGRTHELRHAVCDSFSCNI